MTELVLSEKVGITGDKIMFTSNDTLAVEFKKARQAELPLKEDRGFEMIRRAETFEDYFANAIF